MKHTATKQKKPMPSHKPGEKTEAPAGRRKRTLADLYRPHETEQTAPAAADISRSGASRPPLLRYPPGTAPVSQGVYHFRP
jgi:hypothetical protein